jgi:hypothetical protein
MRVALLIEVLLSPLLENPKRYGGYLRPLRMTFPAF